MLVEGAGKFVLPRISNPVGDFLYAEWCFEEKILGLLHSQAAHQLAG